GPLEGRHPDRRPQGGLGERERHGERQVPSPATEQLVGSDAHDDVEIARRTVVAAGTTPSLDTDALTILDARRDAHTHASGPELGSAAMAGRARRLDPDAAAAAGRARLAEGEEALVVVEHAAPATARAHRGCRTGRRSRPVAGVARGLAHDVDRGRHALHGVLERHVQLGFEIGPPLGARAAGAAVASSEYAAEQVAQPSDSSAASRVLEPERVVLAGPRTTRAAGTAEAAEAADAGTEGSEPAD